MQYQYKNIYCFQYFKELYFILSRFYFFSVFTDNFFVNGLNNGFIIKE